MRNLIHNYVVALAGALSLLASLPAMATFMSGDIFASYGNGTVGVYNSGGSFIQTLDTGTGSYETGSVVNSANGDFYVTNFGASSVSRFDNNGNLLGPFGSGYSNPEDIAIDAGGNIFVSDLDGHFQKYSSSGTLLQTWSLNRIDWFDLSADEKTLFYTNESGAIHRFDLQNNGPLSDFSSSGGQFALRLLSNGDLLATSSNKVTLFDAAGNVLRTYNPNDGELFGMNIESSGNSFITGGINSGNLYRYDIFSGDLLQTISTSGPNSKGLYGLSIYGEATVVNPPSTDVPEPASLALLAVGLLVLTVRVNRRAQS